MYTCTQSHPSIYYYLARVARLHAALRTLLYFPATDLLMSSEVLAEQLSRNIQFLGAEAQEQLASSLVVVIGLGGTGSHCASLLARTGIRRLRFVDCAAISERSLSSHAFARRSDVGATKVEVTRRALLQIVPSTEIEALHMRCDASSAPELVSGATMVLLCIPPASMPRVGASAACSASIPAASAASASSVTPSEDVSCCDLVASISACHTSSTRCIAVLYPGVALPAARTVAHQRLSSLHDINCCAGARALLARARQLIDSPNRPPMPCYDASNSLLCVHAGEHATPRLRLSRPSVVALQEKFESLEPSVRATCDARCALLAGMGDAAASACMTELAGVPLSPTSGIYSRANCDDAHRALQRRERAEFGLHDWRSLDLWPEDCEYLVMEVWGGRCALSRACIGGGGVALMLTRWDRTRPASVGNLILLTKPLAEAHDKAANPLADLPCSFVDAVEATLERARRERAAWAAV